MSGIDVGGKLYDVFIKDPVSYWTDKEPAEVRALDALPVYVGAALWPLAILVIAGCSGQDGYGEDAGDDYVCEDGDVQHSYAGAPETKNVGICQDRIRECIDGYWWTMQEEALPIEEYVGNGLDDDCDGYVDEEDECSTGETKNSYSGPAVTQNVGICQDRVEICTDGSWEVVQEEIIPQEEVEENGLDDDCDGYVDECPEGDVMNSYSGPAETQGVGACHDYMETCIEGLWEVTQQEVLPQPEDYTNGIDDDCDGFVDEIDVDGEITIDIYDSSLEPAFIRLQNGATILFHSTNVTIDTELVEIDSTSKIELVPQACGGGDGSNGTGSDDGGGGGGGAHIGGSGSGGNGGWTGIGGVPGSTYGSTEDFVVEPGSCGGDGGGPYGVSGGFGGGALNLIAGVANIMGTISANGSDSSDMGAFAPYDDGGGGGGSGGAIMIDAGILTVSLASTRLSVSGGNGFGGGVEYAGGGGGGGGGGGSIEIMFDEAIIQSVATYYPDDFSDFIAMMNEFDCLDVLGGFGGWSVVHSGQPGQPGAVNATMP